MVINSLFYLFILLFLLIFGYARFIKHIILASGMKVVLFEYQQYNKRLIFFYVEIVICHFHLKDTLKIYLYISKTLHIFRNYMYNGVSMTSKSINNNTMIFLNQCRLDTILLYLQFLKVHVIH